MTLDASFDETLRAALDAGTDEHYRDAALYDHEYRRRRDDLRYYRRLAGRPRDDRPILELGCGTGRLLLPLARDGHRAVGVDLSATMLARAAERVARLPRAARERVELVPGDFRALRLGRRFPLILCPFNAFMHLYTRGDVERFLAVVRAHLSPGGRFAFDLMNPDLAWLSRDPRRRWARTRFRHPTTRAWMIYSTSLSFDTALEVAFMNIYYEPDRERGARGRTRIVRLAHRYFFPRELEALLHYNGFRLERHDGDFDGAPLTPESEEQVCVARLRGGRR